MTFAAAALALASVAVALSAVMAIGWIVQQRTGNSGWVDTIWTFGLGAIGIGAALLTLITEGGATGRRWLVAALVLAWSLRLGLHIARRSAGTDDPRYAELIKVWGAGARRQMFLLLQKQALVSIPMAMTLVLAAHNPAPLLRAVDAVALILFAAGLAGEALADRQLRDYRVEPGNRAGVCDRGLWAWSRHPNYFSEWLMWLAFALLALGPSWGWLALAGPAAMYWLLTSVSGIPPLEEHMLRTRGAAFRRYQERTSAFFPWPPAAMPHGGRRL